MRHICSAILLVAVFAPCAAMAAGNVLLPSATSGSSTPLPSLGLSATAPAPAAPVAPAPAVAPPAPVIPTPTVSTPAMSMIPQGATPAPIEAKDIIIAVKGDTSHLPPGAIATHIIKMPDNSAMMAQLNKNLPYSIVLAVSGQSMFGAKDVKVIGDKLGLTRDQITSNCILALRGVMRTDKGSYIIDGGNSPQARVAYDGTIKSYLMAGTALCSADNLPMGSGFLTEVGNRFSVPLQTVKCDAPNRQAAQLNVIYDGSGATKCSYD